MDLPVILPLSFSQWSEATTSYLDADPGRLCTKPQIHGTWSHIKQHVHQSQRSMWLVKTMCLHVDRKPYSRWTLWRIHVMSTIFRVLRNNNNNNNNNQSIIHTFFNSVYSVNSLVNLIWDTAWQTQISHKNRPTGGTNCVDATATAETNATKLNGAICLCWR